jgi:hypothetical protein
VKSRGRIGRIGVGWSDWMGKWEGAMGESKAVKSREDHCAGEMVASELATRMMQHHGG